MRYAIYCCHRTSSSESHPQLPFVSEGGSPSTPWAGPSTAIATSLQRIHSYFHSPIFHYILHIICHLKSYSVFSCLKTCTISATDRPSLPPLCAVTSRTMASDFGRLFFIKHLLVASSNLLERIQSSFSRNWVVDWASTSAFTSSNRLLIEAFPVLLLTLRLLLAHLRVNQVLIS